MPRPLALIASALPFVVHAADDAQGGAAPAEDVNPFASFDADASDSSAGNPLSFLAEDATNSPEEEAAEESTEGAATEAAAALPEKIDVDGAEVPLADLQGAYRDRESSAELIEYGKTYEGTMQAFSSGPEGAQAVIQAMINAARDSYGDDAVQGFIPSEALPDGIDEETMTPTERALLGQVQTMKKGMEAQKREFQRTLDELKPAVKDRALSQAGDAYAKTVNASVKGASVDAQTIVGMMKDTGLDDPVKAYKLATYDNAVDSAKASATKEEPRSTMPRPGSTKTFDPKDKNLSADEMIRRMQAGHTPVTA